MVVKVTIVATIIVMTIMVVLGAQNQSKAGRNGRKQASKNVKKHKTSKNTPVWGSGSPH